MSNIEHVVSSSVKVLTKRILAAVLSLDMTATA